MNPTRQTERPSPSLNRLTALCPDGPLQEPPADEVIRAVLAKYERGKSKPEPNEKPNGPIEDIATTAALRNGIDPLAARGLYNRACCPLLRLPDDLLIRWMRDYLSTEDVLCLRHTSRVFLRLFGKKEFEGMWHTTPPPLLGYLPATPVALPSKFRDWFSLSSRLRPDRRRCAECKRLHAYSERTTYMHCTACNADHPEHLFSRKQTQRGAAAEAQAAGKRECVAHEGHVRICAHKTVRLRDVAAAMPAQNLDNHFYDRAGQFRRHQSSAVRDFSSFSVEPDLRVVCDHPSHRQHGGGDATETETGTETETETDSTSDSKPPSYSRFAADSGLHTEAPAFVVHDTMHAGVIHKIATWTYTAHMDVSGLVDGKVDGKEQEKRGRGITAQAFRERLLSLRQSHNHKHSPAHYIAPEDQHGILQELRCVDPDRCGCLLYPGFARRVARHEMACRDHQVTRPLVSRATDIDKIQVRLASCPRQKDCLTIEYTRTIRLQGFYIDPDPRWLPALVAGKRLHSAPLFWTLRDALRDGAVPYGWYQALDPRCCTFDPVRPRHVDAAPHMRNIAWCTGTGCGLNPFLLRDHSVAAPAHQLNMDCQYCCERHIVPVLDADSGLGTVRRNWHCIEIPDREQWQYRGQ